MSKKFNKLSSQHLWPLGPLHQIIPPYAKEQEPNTSITMIKQHKEKNQELTILGTEKYNYELSSKSQLPPKILYRSRLKRVL